MVSAKPLSGLLALGETSGVHTHKEKLLAHCQELFFAFMYPSHYGITRT
jgi:hypothetical protein